MSPSKPTNELPATPVSTRVAAVLGIDPGSRRMGWGVVGCVGEQVRRVASGVIRLDARLPLPERLGVILREVEGLLDRYEPDEVAVETAFVRDNPRTALVLGQARGVPIALAAARSIAVREYAPALVKRHVTGSGRATKDQVGAMVALLLELSEPLQEDEADALAVALAHARAVSFAPVVEGSSQTVNAAVAEAAARPMTASQAWYAAVVQSASPAGRRKRRGR